MQSANESTNISNLTDPSFQALNGMVPSNTLQTVTGSTIRFILVLASLAVCIPGNSVTAYVIWKTPQLRSTTNSLYQWLVLTEIALAFSSTLLNAVYQFYAHVVMASQCDSLTLTKTSSAITRPAPIASTGILLSIAVDRYVAIVHPLHHSSIITDRWVNTAVALSWMVGLTFALTHLVYNLTWTTCAHPVNFILVCVSDSGVYAIAATAMIVLYGLILKTALRQRSKIDAVQMSSSVRADSMTKDNVSRKEWKAAKTTLLIVGSCIVLWFPYSFGRFLQAIGNTAPFTQSFIDVGVPMGYFNHAINWIIYGVTNKNFRTALMEHFRAALRKRIDPQTGR